MSSESPSGDSQDDVAIDLICNLLDRDEPLPDLVTAWPGENSVALRTKLHGTVPRPRTSPRQKSTVSSRTPFIATDAARLLASGNPCLQYLSEPRDSLAANVPVPLPLPLRHSPFCHVWLLSPLRCSGFPPHQPPFLYSIARFRQRSSSTRSSGELPRNPQPIARW